jgi:erythromycin esterase-like protein
VRRAAEPLAPLDHPDFAAPFDRFSKKRVVLLGEASHGTSEFYCARAAITRRLIERHGFSIVAVEADWPDAASVNRYVSKTQGGGQGAQGEPAFQRFPTWMWRNREFEEFVHWLRGHNMGLPESRRAGFYGLDIYNMRGSIAAVLAYLDRTDPGAAKIARERYGCLTPWQRDPATYGRAVLTENYRACEEAVIAQCRDLLDKQLDYGRHDGAQFFDAAQNARLVAAAERYYRIMYYGGAESWNLRDTHMFDTLRHVLDQRGPQSRAVIWAHNSHIGDARQTGMGLERDEINIGQLVRESFGDEAALIGFGTHAGTVAAASDWDGPMEIKQVRPSLPDSWERVMHDHGPGAFLLDMKNAAALTEEKPERFIGVIYRPETERLSHYVEASLARQFDAFVWFDQTQAVTPLEGAGRRGVPDTYPFGL